MKGSLYSAGSANLMPTSKLLCQNRSGLQRQSASFGPLGFVSSDLDEDNQEDTAMDIEVNLDEDLANKDMLPNIKTNLPVESLGMPQQSLKQVQTPIKQQRSRITLDVAPINHTSVDIDINLDSPQQNADRKNFTSQNLFRMQTEAKPFLQLQPMTVNQLFLAPIQETLTGQKYKRQSRTSSSNNNTCQKNVSSGSTITMIQTGAVFGAPPQQPYDLEYSLNLSSQSSPLRGVKPNQKESLRTKQHSKPVVGLVTSKTIKEVPLPCADFISELQLDQLTRELPPSGQKYPDQPQKKGRSKTQKEEICHLPGLGNMGNTCFANSVLQCLTHTPHLQLYLQKAKHTGSGLCPAHQASQQVPQPQPPQLLVLNSVGSHPSQMFLRSATVQELSNNDSKFCAMCILETHVRQILTERERGTKFVYPLSVIILIKKVAQGLFEVGRQCDASEFLLCLLENLIQASFGYINNLPFKLQKETAISRIFQGMLERQIICCSCNNMTKIEEAFLDLSLNININHGVPIYQQNSSQATPVDLLDCISEFFKTDTLDEQNKYHCQSCGRLTRAQTRFRMKNLPRALIVHLKRFTQLGTKLKTPLNFPEVFSFDSDYLLEDVALKERDHAYRLYAIIVHQGYSAHKGHYYCYIRPSLCKGGMTDECEGDENKCWYKYDDESVKLIDDIEAQMLSTQKAYILFYQKVRLDTGPERSKGLIMTPQKIADPRLTKKGQQGNTIPVSVKPWDALANGSRGNREETKQACAVAVNNHGSNNSFFSQIQPQYKPHIKAGIPIQQQTPAIKKESTSKSATILKPIKGPNSILKDKQTKQNILQSTIQKLALPSKLTPKKGPITQSKLPLKPKGVANTAKYKPVLKEKMILFKKLQNKREPRSKSSKKIDDKAYVVVSKKTD